MQTSQGLWLPPVSTTVLFNQPEAANLACMPQKYQYPLYKVFTMLQDMMQRWGTGNTGQRTPRPQLASRQDCVYLTSVTVFIHTTADGAVQGPLHVASSIHGFNKGIMMHECRGMRADPQPC